MTQHNNMISGKLIAASSVIVTSLMFGQSEYGVFPIHDESIVVTEIQPQDDDINKLRLTDAVLDKYRVKPDLAKEIVRHAYRYANDVFEPEDILSIIAIESSFKPNVQSALKRDPAVGLMQVRPGVWRSIVDADKITEVKYQIKYGTQILQTYHRQLGNKRAAIEAYNVGITAYRRGTTAPRYWSKYYAAHQHFVGYSNE